MELAKLKEALDYDSETGEFRWKVTRGKARKGALAGTPTNGYVQIGLGGELFKAHQLAWLFVHGAWPELDMDHINGIRSDNRIVNLREATREVNQQNLRKPHADNRNGLLGVVTNHARFSARIMVRGKPIYLGTFATPEQAHAAYIDAKRQLHSGCTI
jgi:hypothetical protein